MADSKSGWNSLSSKQQASFKKKNFDMKKKVSESQLDLLRKQGTPTKAIKKYGSDPKMREALNRFYGKATVSKIAGSLPNATSPSAAKKSTPANKANIPTGKNSPGSGYLGAGNVANYKTQSRPKDPRGGGNVNKNMPQSQGVIKESLDKKYRYKKASDKRASRTVDALSLLPVGGAGVKGASAATKLVEKKLGRSIVKNATGLQRAANMRKSMPAIKKDINKKVGLQKAAATRRKNAGIKKAAATRAANKAARQTNRGD